MDAAPFNDPRSPDNTILRTPLDKTSGFKGFQLDDSLPYIDESQEASKPPSSSLAPQLSLSPLNLDASGVEEDSFADEKADLSLDLVSGSPPDEIFRQSTGTPPEEFQVDVEEFDAAIQDEIETEEALTKDAADERADSAGKNATVAAGNVSTVAGTESGDCNRENISDGITLNSEVAASASRLTSASCFTSSSFNSLPPCFSSSSSFATASTNSGIVRPPLA